jgi:UTP--glucose-1-phosphate uridylyltransferase
MRDGVAGVSGLIEKPTSSTAPSDYAVCGRYILTDEVRSALETNAKDDRGELQLTSALSRVASNEEILAMEVLGLDGRIDVGSWPGWLRANQLTLDVGVAC